MSPEIERLEHVFRLLQKSYHKARTHDEKVQLAIIARKIAGEYRNLVEHERNASNSHRPKRQTGRIRRSEKRVERQVSSL
jgi:hypothetical protein